MKQLDNFKKFIIKVIGLVLLIFITRFFFQFPVDYFHLSFLRQGLATTVFNKVLALEVFTFIVIFFGFYYRERISLIKHPKTNFGSALFFFFVAEVLVASYYALRYLANIYDLSSGLFLFFTWGLVLVILCLSLFSFIVSVFGYSYLKDFYIEFKKELFFLLLAGAAFYFILSVFQGQWYVFSSNVSAMLYLMLSSFLQVDCYLDSGVPILEVEGFAVGVGSPCSGIDSLFLFFAFFAAIYALDKHKIRLVPFFVFFLLGLLGVYLVNVLRLFLLILVGVYVSPELAVGLFHTNAGWVLFVIYFLCYYLVIKRFIYVQSNPSLKRK